MKDQCEGLTIKGWKFQECDDEFVSILRTRNHGEWSINFGNKYKIIKDVYAYAKLEENGKPWKVKYFDIRTGRIYKGMSQNTKEDSVKELVCIARFYDFFEDPERGVRYRFKELDAEALASLSDCRRELGVVT